MLQTLVYLILSFLGQMPDSEKMRVDVFMSTSYLTDIINTSSHTPHGPRQITKLEITELHIIPKFHQYS